MYYSKIISIIVFTFFIQECYSQTNKTEAKTLDTVVFQSQKCNDCPLTNDTIVYRLLECGLYVSSKGDIGYQTEICKDELCSNFIYKYIQWLYYANETDTVNGGLQEMKYVIDTSTFIFLDFLYWADTNHIYGYNPMSDGGTIFLNKNADRKTFTIFENSVYAKDKNYIFYKGQIIKDADRNTFKIITDSDIPELAYDINNIYFSGEIINDAMIKEFKLKKYKLNP